MTERDTACRKAIIDHCASAPKSDILGGKKSGNSVVRWSDSMVVKWGFGVFEQEYLNQLEAFRILDPAILRVPKALDFFTDDFGRGYLVMNEMPGTRKEAIREEADITALSRILEHFAALKAPFPGPLAQQGPSYALLFGESDHPTFKTTRDLEQWFNYRLLVNDSPLDFSASNLSLCHLDFFPRNILWEPGEPPCLLDWLTAGYWPPIFERCSHMILGDCKSNPAVSREPVGDTEHAQIDLIMTAWSNVQRYAL